MTPRDPEIRAALLAQLARDPSLLVRQEWSHSDAVFDVATIGAELHGFEIKSAFDSLDKLAKRGSQIATYSRVCDRVTVVCARVHVANVHKIVPPWWGITQVGAWGGPGGSMEFVSRRLASMNPAPSMRDVALMLWVTEMVALATRYDCARGPKHKSAFADRLVATLGPRLHDEVLAALRGRDWDEWRRLRDARREASRARNAAMLAQRAERSAQYASLAAFAARMNGGV